MKFSCEKALLQSMVSIASRTVAPKSSIPALEGLLLQAEDGLHLTGYNLKTGIQAFCPAQVQEPGEMVLSARLFGDIIRRMPDELVYLSTEGYKVTIRCGISEFTIQGISAEEYPKLPEVEYQNSVTLPQRTLQTMISQTLFAISTNDSRPIHTGELFEVDTEGMLTIVAVDGYRLALRREKVQKGRSCSFVVPGAALSEVSRICGDTEEPIEIVQGARHVVFRVGEVTLISRRLEGEFLNYRQAIPMNNPIVVLAQRRALMTSIDRCSLIITEQQKSPLRCTFRENLLTLKTATPMGTAYDECPIVGGEDLEIGFNNRYLLDALRAAPADNLRVTLNTPVSPCVILPEEGKEQNFIYMVLPVRLRA